MNTLWRLPLLATCAGISMSARAAPGDLDPVNVGTPNDAVLGTAVQPDGKIIIGGRFTAVPFSRQYMARLNSNGALDFSFDPKPNAPVWNVGVQPDGKILLVGEFTTLQPNVTVAPTSRQYIARLNTDGTLDSTFDPRANTLIFVLAIQADGKVLVGGIFNTFQPNGAGTATMRRNIARLNADGTLDASFDPKPNGSIYSLAVQADGKVLVGGTFTTLQPNGAITPTARRHIARVNPDGTLDPGFDPAANDDVYSIAVQADGKIMFGGSFITLQPNGADAPTARQYIARVNADGTLDAGFDPLANGALRSIVLQADGSALLGGHFTTLQPNGAGPVISRQRIARVYADGTLDAGFDPKADDDVRSLALQADGKVLPGGYFTSFQPNGAGGSIPSRYLARLQNDPAIQILTAPDPTQILWQRGGSAPEVSSVTFDLSTNGGGNWTPRGAGIRIGTTANWRLSGLALPGSGQLRARGVTIGGQRNGSSGLIELIVTFPPFTTDADADGLYDNWELAWWPTTAGHSAGDDFDNDGYNELLELALGLNPTVSNPGGLPAVTNEGGYLTMTITKQPGVTYEVQSAGTVLPALPDSFSAASTTVPINNATTLKVRDNFLIGTPSSRFMRVKVTAAP